MKRIALALIAVLALASAAEAGLFRRKSGERRQPVRSVLRGCAGGVCR